MAEMCICGQAEVVETKFGPMCIFCWRDFFEGDRD